MATTIAGRLYTPEDSSVGTRDIIHPETDIDQVINTETGKTLGDWMEGIEDKTREATSLNGGIISAETKRQYDELLSERTFVTETQPNVSNTTGCMWARILATE